MLGDGVLHQRRAQLQVLLADARGGARHPERAVLHLLAQVDQEGLVVGQLEPPARELADQRRLPRSRPSKSGQHHGELAQHVGDGVHPCSALSRRASGLQRGSCDHLQHHEADHGAAAFRHDAQNTLARFSRAALQQRVKHDPDRGRADVAGASAGWRTICSSGIIALVPFRRSTISSRSERAE